MEKYTEIQAQETINDLLHDANLSYSTHTRDGRKVRSYINELISEIESKTEKSIKYDKKDYGKTEIKTFGYVEPESNKLCFTGRPRYKRGKLSGCELPYFDNIVKFKTQIDLTFGTESQIKVSEFRTIKNSDSKYSISHWVDHKRKIYDSIQSVQLWIDRIEKEIKNLNLGGLTMSKRTSSHYSDSVLCQAGITSEEIARYRLSDAIKDVKTCDELLKSFVSKVDKRFGNIEKTVSRLEHSIENRMKSIERLKKVNEATDAELIKDVKSFSQIVGMPISKINAKPLLAIKKLGKIKKDTSGSIDKLEKSVKSLSGKLELVKSMQTGNIEDLVKTELKNIGKYYQ